MTKQASIQYLDEEEDYNGPSNQFANRTYRVGGKKFSTNSIHLENMSRITLSNMNHSKAYLDNMIRSRPKLGQVPNSENKFMKDFITFNQKHLKDAL